MDALSTFLQQFKAVAESFSEIDVVRMGIWTRSESIPVTADEPELARVDTRRNLHCRCDRSPQIR